MFWKGEANLSYSLKFSALRISQIPLPHLPFDEDGREGCVTGWQGPCPWCGMGLLDGPRCHFASVPVELPGGSALASAADGRARQRAGLAPPAACSGWPVPQGPLRHCGCQHTCKSYHPVLHTVRPKDHLGHSAPWATHRRGKGERASSRYHFWAGGELKHQPRTAPRHLYTDKQSRPGLDVLPLNIPSSFFVREGKLTASNYPGPLVMTLCPLQFPWDTVPLLPSSSELRGTRLTYQNCFFFFSPGLRLC